MFSLMELWKRCSKVQSYKCLEQPMKTEIMPIASKITISFWQCEKNTESCIPAMSFHTWRFVNLSKEGHLFPYNSPFLFYYITLVYDISALKKQNKNTVFSSKKCRGRNLSLHERMEGKHWGTAHYYYFKRKKLPVTYEKHQDHSIPLLQSLASFLCRHTLDIHKAMATEVGLCKWLSDWSNNSQLFLKD